MRAIQPILTKEQFAALPHNEQLVMLAQEVKGQILGTLDLVPCPGNEATYVSVNFRANGNDPLGKDLTQLAYPEVDCHVCAIGAFVVSRFLLVGEPLLISTYMFARRDATEYHAIWAHGFSRLAQGHEDSVFTEKESLVVEALFEGWPEFLIGLSKDPSQRLLQVCDFVIDSSGRNITREDAKSYFDAQNEKSSALVAETPES